jgi:3'-phosphoadenosine 5'-phosphosulfate (PAPS) 3'-phosphatase
VVGELRAAFPTDQVVAEETSAVLRQDPEALKAVTDVVRKEGVGTGGYSAEDVCQVLDHGRTRTWRATCVRVLCVYIYVCVCVCVGVRVLVLWWSFVFLGCIYVSSFIYSSIPVILPFFEHTHTHTRNPTSTWTAGGARTWILDPIDGTKGFIRGEHFCVALGLALHGEPSLGVLACPNLPFRGHRDNGAKLGDGCLFFAVRGAGAFVMPLTAAAGGASVEAEIEGATPIQVSGVASGADARFFESAEAVHSAHSAAGQVTQGECMQECMQECMHGQVVGCDVGDGGAAR